jgi:Ca-activated chloride channel family protein
MQSSSSQLLEGDSQTRQSDTPHPSDLILRVVVSHTRLPIIAEEQACYVLLSVSLAHEVSYVRLPLNLCIILDHSTSMHGMRLQYVREATRQIVEKLKPEDTLSLVVFNDRAEVLLPAQRNFDKVVAKSVVSAIQPGGGTEMLQGLLTGMKEAMRGRSNMSLNHVILLTDGHTYGDERGCLEMAKWAGENQVSISPLGIGEDWNEDLLDDMATQSGGASTYIDSPRKVVDALEETLRRLNKAVARQSVLRITPGPSVRLHEVFQVVPYISRLAIQGAESAAAILGPLGGGRGKVVLMEFRIQDATPGKHPIARIVVDADVPGTSGKQLSASIEPTIDFAIASDAMADLRISSGEIPTTIPNALSKITLYKMQEKVIANLEAGQIEAATQRLEALAARLASMGEIELARSAMLEAGQLARSGTLSPEGRKKMHYGTRSLSFVPSGIDND